MLEVDIYVVAGGREKVCCFVDNLCERMLREHRVGAVGHLKTLVPTGRDQLLEFSVGQSTCDT